MKRHTITLGASTTAGGKVISASSHGTINGARIALENDKIFCPACKLEGRIVSIGPRVPELWDGKNVALEDDLCSCGCSSPPRLVPNQSIRYQVIGESAARPAGTSETSTTGKPTDNQLALFDDRYVLIDDETGKPLSNTEYALMRGSGEVEFGTTDLHGHTHLLAALAEAESIQIYL